MCFKEFYFVIINIHVIILAKFYVYQPLRFIDRRSRCNRSKFENKTGQFPTTILTHEIRFLDKIIFLQNVHLCLKFPKAHESGHLDL